MKGLTAVAALALALLAAGAASAATAVSVTVKKGDHLAGDVRSLDAIDENTVSVAAKTGGGTRYLTVFIVDFGVQPEGDRYVEYAAAVDSTRNASCRIGGAQREISESSLSVDTVPLSSEAGDVEVKVRCKSPVPFTLHVDKFTLEYR